MLRPTVSRPMCLEIKHTCGAYDQNFVTVRQLRGCWCGALPVTRERVCRVQLLLVLASVVILGSGSHGTRDHILLSQMLDFPFRRLLQLAGLRWRDVPPCVLFALLIFMITSVKNRCCVTLTVPPRECLKRNWPRLSPLGTSATSWPIVPAPDHRWWTWSSRWNEKWQGKPKYSEKTFPNATSSTTNPTWLTWARKEWADITSRRFATVYLFICLFIVFNDLSISYWVYVRQNDMMDRLCGLVVRVPGYRSRGPGSIPDATRFSEK
jgi:hypothetical protein